MIDLIRNGRRFVPPILALVLTAAGFGQVEEVAEAVAELVARQDVEGLRSRGPEALEELLALYERSDAAGRANIAWHLYHLGWPSEAARELLMRDVRSEHDALRVWAQYALGRVSRDDSVVDVLFENLKRTGDKWLYRDKAACGLAYDQIHLTEPQKVRLFMLLIGGLDDEDPGTRQLVIQVLAVRTGQTKGYDPKASAGERAAAIERWWRWWNEYRTEVEGTG